MFEGFDIEPYKPGKQKMPFTILTIVVILGYYILVQSTAHVKKHSINKPWPELSPILDEHFYFDDALLHRVMNQFHPKLLKEYIWLLFGRSAFMFVVAIWGAEMILRVSFSLRLFLFFRQFSFFFSILQLHSHETFCKPFDNLKQ
jgi:hypothetical protein